MTVADAFRHEQRGVAIRMVAALCVTILVSAICLHLGTAQTLPERLVAVAQADLFVLCWLAATIGNVARLRFFSPDDIAGSGSTSATAKVRHANAILQSTLEQVALAIPVHVALAVLVTSSTALIVGLVALFAIGRWLFWIGYARGAQARAFGFTLTFYPSVAGLVITAFAVMFYTVYLRYYA